MRQDQVFVVVRAIVAQEASILDVAGVTNEAELIGDLGMDSHDVIGVFLELEDRFELDIPDRDAAALVTVGLITSYICRKIA